MRRIGSCLVAVFAMALASCAGPAAGPSPSGSGPAAAPVAAGAEPLDNEKRPPRPIRIIAAPDLSATNKNERGLAARPEEGNSPDVAVEVIETFREGDNTQLILNYVNRTDLQGNKSVHVYHYDSLGRVVNVSSRLIYFRPYQQLLDRITVPASANAVRWVVQVK